jgi:hypothetical protein
MTKHGPNNAHPLTKPQIRRYIRQEIMLTVMLHFTLSETTDDTKAGPIASESHTFGISVGH